MPFGLITSVFPAATDYTAARAALIDRLALLQAGGAGELTIARAALLTNLDATISGRLGSIKSIQAGTINIPVAATTNTATITAVVLAKTFLLHLGQQGSGATTTRALIHIVLTNTTTITATRNSTSDEETVSFMIVEFN